MGSSVKLFHHSKYGKLFHEPVDRILRPFLRYRWNNSNPVVTLRRIPQLTYTIKNHPNPSQTN